MTREQLKTLQAKVNDCFEAAAIATETKVKYQWGQEGIVEGEMNRIIELL
jgi:hypothetical protein